ncbi:MAG TPA: hypothetical protein PLJ21_03735 [Pseudobdellovibrionaceae bacterium]|nr:hypothetical protein [Pseudobdellovibrionaceae bacterium]
MIKLSAIDIGSNAIRMIVAETPRTDALQFKTIKKLRAPLRLGAQVFLTGQIAPLDIEIATQIFKDFQKENELFKVKKCKAVATSATRDAKNQSDFLSAVFNASGIKIEVIDGVEEARLIHLAIKKKYNLLQKNALLIDVGGGSVEVSFSQNAQLTSTQSFPLGTVRLIDELKKRKATEDKTSLIIAEQLNPLSHHIHAHIDKNPVTFAIGTGGNLEFLLDFRNRFLSKKPKKYFTYSELTLILNILKSTTLKERMEKYDIKKDRADVIFPAALVVQTILHQSEVRKVYVPKVGLREGVLWSMI